VVIFLATRCVFSAFTLICEYIFCTKAVSSNPAHDEVYSIQHYVIKTDIDLLQVSSFLPVLGFPPPIILTATI